MTMPGLRRLWSLALLSFLLGLVPSQLYALPRAGQPAPNFKTVSSSGQMISQENYRGYVLIVDFFATWCLPCRASIPHLVELKRKYGKQGLQILGLDADDEGDRAINAFAEELRVNYPLAVAGDRIQLDFGIRSVPILFVIDKKGVLVDSYRGFNDEIGRSLEQTVKRLLTDK